MFRKFLLITLSLFSNAFLNPTLKLSSGKSLSLIGKGPPLFFSTGLQELCHVFFIVTWLIN